MRHSGELCDGGRGPKERYSTKPASRRKKPLVLKPSYIGARRKELKENNVRSGATCPKEKPTWGCGKKKLQRGEIHAGFRSSEGSVEVWEADSSFSPEPERALRKDFSDTGEKKRGGRRETPPVELLSARYLLFFASSRREMRKEENTCRR